MLLWRLNLNDHYQHHQLHFKHRFSFLHGLDGFLNGHRPRSLILYQIMINLTSHDLVPSLLKSSLSLLPLNNTRYHHCVYLHGWTTSICLFQYSSYCFQGSNTSSVILDRKIMESVTHTSLLQFHIKSTKPSLNKDSSHLKESES